MTNLNEVVAMHKGWKREKELQGLSVERDIWIAPKAMFSFPAPPDYLNDARLYMGLFEEIKKTGFEFRLESDTTGSGEGIYTAVILEQRNDTNGTGWGLRVISTQSSIGTAICQAYCKLHGLE